MRARDKWKASLAWHIFFKFSLLQLVLPVLGHLKVPDSIEGRQKMFQFTEKSVVSQILKDFLLDVLLMPYRCESFCPFLFRWKSCVVKFL